MSDDFVQIYIMECKKRQSIAFNFEMTNLNKIFQRSVNCVGLYYQYIISLDWHFCSYKKT